MIARRQQRKIFEKILLLLVTLISIIFLVNNLQSVNGTSTVYILSIFIFAFIVIYIHRHSPPPQKMLHLLRRLFADKLLFYLALFIVALIGIFARFYFLISPNFELKPVSDPASFYITAQGIKENTYNSDKPADFKPEQIEHNTRGLKYNTYVSFNPYLAAYDSLLGLAMKVIPSGWAATISLNILFDLASGAAIIIAIKKLTGFSGIRYRVISFAAFTAWILNPFGIIFSALPLPIEATNLSIILSIFIASLFVQSLKQGNWRQTALWSIILGIAVGIGNQFRPVMIIILIATIITSLLITLDGRTISSKLKATALLLPAIVTFIIVSCTGHAIIESNVGLDIADKPSGWSIFVGANWISSGSWNLYDVNERNQICQKANNADECHRMLTKAGIERYRSYGLKNSLSLILRKMLVFSGHQVNIYNADSISGYNKSKLSTFYRNYTLIYVIAIFTIITVLSIKLYSLVNKSKTSAIDAPLILLLLSILGLVSSSLLVEVSIRYAQVIYPCFILYIILGGTYLSKQDFTR